MNDLENKKISAVSLSLYIIAGIIFISFLPALISLLYSKQNSIPKDDDIQQNYGREQKDSKYIATIIKLSEEKETIDIDDNLKIEFEISNSSADVKLYKAMILLNDKTIDSSFFDGSNIWAEDYTGIFYVYDVDNYYVFVSSAVKQCDGNYVLIIKKNGEVFKTYSDVDFKISKSIITIVDNDNNCSIDNNSSYEDNYDLKDF